MRALLIAVTVTAGCATAPVDPDKQYARDDAQIRAFEQFEVLKRECRAKGGVMLVDRVGRLGPSVSELRMARCTSKRPMFHTGDR